MGQTKRAFGTRLEEVSNQNFTRSKRKESESQNNNSVFQTMQLGLIILLAGRTQTFLEERHRERPGGYASQFGLDEWGGQ